jgi:hypothetical protein
MHMAGDFNYVLPSIAVGFGPPVQNAAQVEKVEAYSSPETTNPVHVPTTEPDPPELSSPPLGPNPQQSVGCGRDGPLTPSADIGRLQEALRAAGEEIRRLRQERDKIEERLRISTIEAECTKEAITLRYSLPLIT